MNSLEFNARAFFRCCSFYWERRMKRKIKKKILRACFEEDGLNDWEMTQGVEMTNS